jgi:hypothetical protein
MAFSFFYLLSIQEIISTTYIASLICVILAPSAFLSGPIIGCVGICSSRNQSQDKNYRMQVVKIDLEQKKPDMNK